MQAVFVTSGARFPGSLSQARTVSGLPKRK